GWQDLKDLFRGAGIVQRANIMQGKDGRSKGHGIVLYATLDDAKKAQDMFNGYEWHGRPLEVREDRSIVDFSLKKPAIAQSEDVNKLTEALDHNLSIKGDSGNDGEAKEATAATAELYQAGSSENTNGVHESTKSTESSEAAAAVIKAAAQKRTIHVGNIPFRMRWQDLKDLFRKAGRIVRADVALGPENRSRGFGTVIFATEEEAKKAITMFDQYHWQDRVIQVQEDRSVGENSRHQEGGHSHGMGPGHGGPFFRNPPPMNHGYTAGRQVFVGNDLKDLFRKAGDIIRADVAVGFDGRSRGFGSVLFTTPEDATTAISMFDNYDLNGRFLKVHYDRFAPMGHGPPMHGNMGHIMHPHSHHPHPHAHPHQPHHHPHRLLPMHAQHNHGFPLNFHQASMMPLGTLPMIHGANAPGQFNMGPPPFGGRNFSPTLLGPGSIHAAEFLPSEESTRTNTSPLLTDLPGPVGSNNDNRVASPQFDSGAVSAIGVVSPTSPSSGAVSGTGAVAFPSGSGPLQPPHPESPSQQYPFMSHLGPIGKPNHIHGHLSEHSSAGLLSNASTGIPISEVGPSSEDDFVSRNPYHFGNSIGQSNDDGSVNIHNNSHGDAFSPEFYMYPGFLQTPQSQQQQHQELLQQVQQQQQQQQHSPSQQQSHDQHQQHQTYQQHQQHGYPLYQDQYLQDQSHLGHPHNGVVGGQGGNGLGHGYPNQPEWVAHPNSFMMGSFHHLYGLPQFGQYGHHRGLNGEVAVESEGGEESRHQ
ncbi:hypothetical protein BGX27_010199, partial [Mortierella sp. AM989]